MLVFVRKERPDSKLLEGRYCVGLIAFCTSTAYHSVLHIVELNKYSLCPLQAPAWFRCLRPHRGTNILYNSP